MNVLSSKKAFTLIELLIVVAIIAILAAIAVPNFLEAQTRAKVSRAKADLRTLATAIESYTVDNNKPVREWNTARYPDPPFNGSGAGGIIWPGGEGTDNVFRAGLSTPISYITNAMLGDPFVRPGDNIPEDEKTFSYKSISEALQVAENGGDILFFNRSGIGGTDEAQIAQQELGAWSLISNGPDRSYFNTPTRVRDNSFNGCEYIVYDPSNGTVSFGNIIRSQKNSDDVQSSNTDFLGPHG